MELLPNPFHLLLFLHLYPLPNSAKMKTKTKLKSIITSLNFFIQGKTGYGKRLIHLPETPVPFLISNVKALYGLPYLISTTILTFERMNSIIEIINSNLETLTDRVLVTLMLIPNVWRNQYPIPSSRNRILRILRLFPRLIFLILSRLCHGYRPIHGIPQLWHRDFDAPFIWTPDDMPSHLSSSFILCLSFIAITLFIKITPLLQTFVQYLLDLHLYQFLVLSEYFQ